jgi:hypothetical protein
LSAAKHFRRARRHNESTFRAVLRLSRCAPRQDA